MNLTLRAVVVGGVVVWLFVVAIVDFVTAPPGALDVQQGGE